MLSGDRVLSYLIPVFALGVTITLAVAFVRGG